MASRARSFVAAAALALVLGCAKSPGDPAEYGELVVFETGGSTLPGRDVTFDFGEALSGAVASRKIGVRNEGKGSLVLESLQHLAGHGVRPAGAEDASAPFRSNFEAGRTLASSELTELVAFAPVGVAAESIQETRLQLRVQGARPGEETATLTLRGTAVPFDCVLPAELDFGNVAVGDTWKENIALTNPLSSPLQAKVEPIVSIDDAGSFALAEVPAGLVTIPPGSTLQVPISFRPRGTGSPLKAAIKIKPAAHCAFQSVSLIGNAVSTVITHSPEEVDCGYVTPGSTATRELSFTNGGNRDLELTGIHTLNVAEFGVDPTGVTIPAHASAQVTVSCSPKTYGPRSTSLVFQANDPWIPPGAVLVRVEGGGPAIEVGGALDVGEVAYFPGASATLRRSLLVRNVGTRPASGAASGNLRLGVTDQLGNVVPDTYFTVTPSDDFIVTVSATYDPQKGLVARAGEDSVPVFVTFRPTSLGTKTAELAIHSNDSDEPIVKVSLRGEAISLPPCQYSVSTTALPFGLVPPPETRERIVRIRNEGTAPGDDCLFYGASPPAPTPQIFFAPPQYVGTTTRLAPGEAIDLRVSARPRMKTPTSQSTSTGTLLLQFSSPTKPMAQVTLSATIGASCLLVGPNALDFGTAEVGCSSATRTFNIHNRCSTSLSIGAVRVLSAPLADPLCTTSAGCPFAIASAPSIPSGGLAITDASAPVPLQVRFRPGSDDAHFDALAIDFTEAGATATLLVPLEGTGSAIGTHAETFVLPATPVADVLLVIDDSRLEHGQLVRDHAESFLKYAFDSGADFHIGVTTMHPGITAGTLVSDPATHPEKVLEPSTTDLLRKFKEKVMVGSMGNVEAGTKAAHDALTAPFVNDENAGFLRDDSVLGVVHVASEPDHSLRTTQYYLDAFWNLKGHHRKERFSISPVVSFSALCWAYPDLGEYAHYALQTAGERAEFCTANAADFERIGKVALGYRTTYLLNVVPDLASGTVAVEINGASVAPTSNGTQVWFYDPLRNAVTFNPLYTPTAGQTLKVSYPVTCHP